MIKTTVGQFLANDALPATVRDYNRVYDQKGLDHVLEILAHEHPEKYREALKKLTDLGGEVAFREGGLTFGTEHLQRPAGAEALAKNIEQQAHKIYLDPKMSQEQKNKAIISLLESNQANMTEASYGQALKDKNPLALQASLGFRGSKSSINGMIGAGLLYSDYKGDKIPFPITRSFAQGLSPMQFMASTFGGRTGVLSTKLATAEAGALNKQLTQSAHQVMIDRDDEEGDWHRGPSPRGLPVDTGDKANVGTLLAHDVAGYTKNTVLTPKILRDLQEKGEDRILVRSPLVGGTIYGGVHARDAGIRNSRGLPQSGSFLGVETGQGVGEPLTQLQLSKKHLGGVAGSSKVGGFKLIESLANPPKQMPYGASHAQTDGRVDRIDENPAGGKDVWVGGKKHYVPSQMDLRVKMGDTIEAGDVLSDGIPNPRDVVAHKGIGEGRRYLMQTMHDAYRENGVHSRALRRNLEPVVRGLVDHVVMTDFWNGHTPDDVVKYSHIENNWTPRPGYVNKNPRAAVGKYLEAPVLHHTVGTQIKPSMIPEMERFKVGQVMVHNDPPPFKPNLLRATENLQHDDDWQVRLGGQYLQRGLLDSAHRGLTSSTHGSSFIPALIRGDDLPSSLSKQPGSFGK
jgi:DNA-directed RNA polymerase subunit beta'